jgi:hypothetical protein
MIPLDSKKLVNRTVPDSKGRNIPEVVIIRHGQLGLWEFGKGRDSWVKGGANGVSLQAT